MYIKSISSDCGANKWAISAFYTCTTGMKNENKKNQKKIFRERFYSKAKIFRKNFFTKKSRNDSVAAGAQIGGVYLQRTRRHNIGTLRTFRTYIVCACRAFRAVSACVPENKRGLHDALFPWLVCAPK